MRGPRRIARRTTGIARLPFGAPRERRRAIPRAGHRAVVTLVALTLFVGLAALAANLAWTRYAASLRPLDLAASREGSTLVVDRDGRLLRAFTLPDGRWRLPATTHDVDPRYVAMLIAYEDGRFTEHSGVDPPRAASRRGTMARCAAISSPAVRRFRCRSRA